MNNTIGIQKNSVGWIKYLLIVPYFLIPYLWTFFEQYQLVGPKPRVILTTITFAIPLYFVFLTNERIFNIFKPRSLLLRIVLLGILLAGGAGILYSWLEFQSNPNLELFGSGFDSIIKILMFLFGIVLVAKSGADLIRLKDNLNTVDIQDVNILNWPQPRKVIQDSEYLDTDDRIFQNTFNKSIRRLDGLISKDVEHGDLLMASYQEIDDNIGLHATKIHRTLSGQYGWPTDSLDLFVTYYIKKFSTEFNENRLTSILNSFISLNTEHVNSNELMKLIYLLSGCNKYSEFQTKPNTGLMGLFIANNSYSEESNLNFNDKLRLTSLFIITAWKSESYNNNFDRLMFRGFVRDIEEILRAFETILGLSGARKSYTEIFISQSTPVREIELTFILENELASVADDYISKLFNRTSLMHQNKDEKFEKKMVQIESKLEELIRAYVTRGD
jgi:hypothetical protein